MDSTLFKAILAMDSYNRGYNAGIKLGDADSPEGEEVGTATVYDSKGDAPAKNISFYAVAYSYNGETVISYRGTDDKVPDIANGYGVGAGMPGGPQATMAVDFYQAVASALATDAAHYSVTLTGPSLKSANIDLTGHSLGGGLAGYVASLYGRQATLH